MDKKRIWKRAFVGLLIVTLFMTNAVSVIAQETGNVVEVISGNDISVSGSDETKEEKNSPDIFDDAVDIESTEETENIESIEELVQPFSLEAGGYDISAADATYTAGENVTAYYFAADCMLLFEGSGAMTDWTTASEVPWSGKTINTAIIENGITTVGAYALSYHTELSGVFLPDTLKSIGSYAFCVQNETRWTVGSLSAIEIPYGVETIGAYAFRGNKLAAVYIPDSVTDIGESAFVGCRDVKSLSIGVGLSEIADYAFAYLTSVGSLTIPDNVTTIKSGAFYQTGATEIMIGNGVKEIGRSAFYLCDKVQTATFGSGLESIGQMAFAQCKKLETLVIPDSVKTIGIQAFKDCYSLSSLTLGSGVKTIGNNAFDGARVLESLNIPDNVTQIGDSSFYDSRALKAISIGKGVIGIGSRAFFVFDTTETKVITANDKAIKYDWTDNGRTVTFQSMTVFKDRSGNSVKEVLLTHGDTVMDKTPAMEDYEEGGYIYTFTGWLPEITEDTRVTGEAEYTAQYAKTAKKYKVLFKNHDGEILKEIQLPYGDTVLDQAPAAFREPDTEHIYMFTGWLPELNEGTTVTGEAEYTAEYSTSARNRTVTFIDYDGKIILQKTMERGALIYPEAPIPKREENGLSSYAFKCWYPALNKTDTLTEDTVYTAKYWRLTKTGLRISNEINIPAGNAVGTSDITATPIYTMYDENDGIVKTLWDEETKISDFDIRLSKDRIERGVNEITVEQISTGLTGTTEVFGSYIDGITVWQPPEELEAGTRLEELGVYFTWTMLDKAGEIQTGFPDIERSVKYTLNDADFVDITEGNNEIRVTETESGNRYQTVIHVRGVPKTTSGNDTSGNDTSENDASGNDTSGNGTSGNDASGNDTSDNNKPGENESGNGTSDNDTSGNDASGNDTSDNNKPGGTGDSESGSGTLGKDISDNDTSGNDASGNDKPGGSGTDTSGNDTSGNDNSGNDTSGNDASGNDTSDNNKPDGTGDGKPESDTPRNDNADSHTPGNDTSGRKDEKRDSNAGNQKDAGDKDDTPADQQSQADENAGTGTIKRIPKSCIRHYEPVMPDYVRQKPQQESIRECPQDDERKVKGVETSVKEEKDCCREGKAFFCRCCFWMMMIAVCIGIMLFLCLLMEVAYDIRLSGRQASWKRAKRK